MFFQGYHNEHSGTALDLMDTMAQIVNCTLFSIIVGVALNTSPNTIIIFVLWWCYSCNQLQTWSHPNQIFSNIITIDKSKLDNNSAYNGGVQYSYSCNITIDKSDFENNTASNGGVLYIDNSNITIDKNKFDLTLPLVVECCIFLHWEWPSEP